ncbi:MAG: hypothetical protein LC647_17685 [Beggiatoa sp.]|nr:hypothetical protein [Beggiatoa sp.]
MTLDQFKAKVKPSLDCREKIATLRRQLKAAIKKRQECDAASIDVCAKVVNAVRGDIAHGEDSTLYKALGLRAEERTQERSAPHGCPQEGGLSRAVSVRSGDRVEHRPGRFFW